MTTTPTGDYLETLYEGYGQRFRMDKLLHEKPAVAAPEHPLALPVPALGKVEFEVDEERGHFYGRFNWHGCAEADEPDCNIPEMDSGQTVTLFPVEPETVRSYLKFNVGDAYDPATGLVPDRLAPAAGRLGAQPGAGSERGGLPRRLDHRSHAWPVAEKARRGGCR